MASDLPVDLLEEIFLRLDDAVDLVRASATCAPFRRVGSDSRFLRRFRSVHRRPVLGLVFDERHGRHDEQELFYAAQPPRHSAPAAAGFAKAADFSFSFLRDRSNWHVCDVRDGRVLLARLADLGYMFQDLVVYDPLNRRHVEIPTIPGDLLQAAEHFVDHGNNKIFKLDKPFLAPPTAKDEIADDDESSVGFRVMRTALSKTKTEVVVFVFSSASGQWRQCGSSFHSHLSHQSEIFPWMWSRWYVHGCICWADHAANFMLVFDTNEMKLSIVDLPQESIDKYKMAVELEEGGLGLFLQYKMAVELEEGRLGLFLLDDGCIPNAAMDLYSKDLPGIQQEQEEWRHDSAIPLIPGFHFMFAGAAEGYVLLRGIPRDQLKDWFHNGNNKKPEAHYFILDLKTLLVEKLCVLESYERSARFLYASFPPPFSPPTV